MLSAEELESMGRILIAIDTYRHQIDDQTDLPGSKSVDVYLKHCLSRQDWRVWSQLRVKQTLVSPVPDKSLLGHTQKFSLLIGQYKRAVYEQMHVLWQGKSDLL